MNETVIWGSLAALVLTIVVGAYGYSFRVLALKEKALAAGVPVVELECIDPGRDAIAACLLLAQKVQK